MSFLPAWAASIALIVGWSVLAVSTGVVAVYSVSAMLKGVGTVWPMAVLFGVVGLMAGGIWGLAAGLAGAAVIGLWIGR
jgi:hypothetical protein